MKFCPDSRKSFPPNRSSRWTRTPLIDLRLPRRTSISVCWMARPLRTCPFSWVVPSSISPTNKSGRVCCAVKPPFWDRVCYNSLFSTCLRRISSSACKKFVLVVKHSPDRKHLPQLLGTSNDSEHDCRVSASSLTCRT
uniref:(northern house mosquito) hypothetical protein n=1 Tax=Culex pipiens TaxID=7175 RepID=A0A8D8KWC0_CULPI